MPRTESIAQGLKNNRRLVTFSIDKPQEFLDHLKTCYNSEIEYWCYICKPTDWKYEFIARELKIREASLRLRRLEELAAVW